MNDFAPVNIGTNGLQELYNKPLTGNAAAVQNRLVPTVQRGNDRVELSNTARIIDRLRNGDVQRPELIAQVRAEIKTGRYETPEKIDAAIEELFTDL